MDVEVFLTAGAAHAASRGPSTPPGRAPGVAVPEPVAETERTVAVVDVLRWTSTVVTALANGATAVYPTVETEEALRLVQSLGREGTALCGERRGRPIEGFDLGNSPGEFTRERIDGCQLVMTTTNGTAAFHAFPGASRKVAVSFLNLGAAAEALVEVEALAVVCAGRTGRYAAEDAVCAGALLERIAALRSGRGLPAPKALDDAVGMVRGLAERTEVGPSFLAETVAGRALAEIGLGADLAWCARVDRYEIVPEMYDRAIRIRPS